MAKTYLTQAKYEELLKELDKMKKSDRREVANEIAVAREKGDLRENAEYDAAREKQAHLERRIHELEDKLTRVEIVENLDFDTEVINISAVVQLEDVKSKEKLTYSLVGPDESDYAQGKISVTSPVGRGLLGHKKGEIVKIQVPAGILEYKVLDFNY